MKIESPEHAYISSGAFAGCDIAAILERCDATGVTKLELGSGLRCSEAELRDLERRREAGMMFLPHNYFPAPEKPFVLNLASADSEILCRSMDHCKRGIEIATRLGSPFFSVHAGFMLNLEPSDLGKPTALQARLNGVNVNRMAAMDQFCENVYILADLAQSSGVDLLIENNVVSLSAIRDDGENGLLLADANEISQFFSDTNHPALGLLVDVGHVNVSATALGFDRANFMEKVSPYLRAFHLSSNDGQHDSNKFFHSSDWFASWLPMFQDTARIIEVYAMTNDELIHQYQILGGIIE